MSTYEALRESIISGKKQEAVDTTQAFLKEGKSAGEILHEGLLPGMAVVGQRFEDGEFFIPEMLLAARALNAGLDLLRPFLEASNVKPVAKVVIGTVKGDIHDIGKNLVAVMLRGAGFEVIDAGVDVTPEKFISLAKEAEAEIIGLSALLTTTMTGMKDVIAAIENEGLKDQMKVIIGGAPVTDEYAKKIGADGFARNASAAVAVAKSLVAA